MHRGHDAQASKCTGQTHRVAFRERKGGWVTTGTGGVFPAEAWNAVRRTPSGEPGKRSGTHKPNRKGEPKGSGERQRRGESPTQSGDQVRQREKAVKNHGQRVSESDQDNSVDRAESTGRPRGRGHRRGGARVVPEGGETPSNKTPRTTGGNRKGRTPRAVEEVPRTHGSRQQGGYQGKKRKRPAHGVEPTPFPHPRSCQRSSKITK